MAKTMILETNISSYYMAILFSLFSMFIISLVAVDTNATIGFSVDLIHIDSPQSPIFDPSLSPLQRLINTLQRSSNRTQYLESIYSRKSLVTNIYNENGAYIIRYSIGTPPVPAFAYPDTGSDLIWTQCQPCVKCFKQDGSIFDPRTSSTFQKVPCLSPACLDAPNPSCGDSLTTCFYHESYGDKSFTKGILATETLTLSSTFGGGFPLPKIVFGCGSNNEGTARVDRGIIGLGGGNYSLVGQLKNRIGGKFSYCLVSEFSKLTTSRLHFGSKAVVSGPGVVSTPIVPGFPSTFYYLTLDAISIQGNSFTGDRKGNIIIDCGTTVTKLPPKMYNDIVGLVTSLIRLERYTDSIGLQLEVCYIAEHDIEFPDIIFHFQGADLKLGSQSTFIRVDEDIVCFAFMPSEDEIGIFGNLLQTNFLIGYDLNQMTVSFKPEDCSLPL